MPRIPPGRLAALVALWPAASLAAPTTHRAELTGYEEVPAVSTAATGRAVLRISDDGKEIAYELSYLRLEGTVTVAHIHLGQKGVQGGIVAFLCGGPGKAKCPQDGTVIGTVTADDIVAVRAQGIDKGELADLVRAIRAGAAFVNVHSTKFPLGEIRGQLETGPVTPAVGVDPRGG